MLRALAEASIHRVRTVLLVALAAAVVAGVFGADVARHLSTGGFTDTAAESAQAQRYLEKVGWPAPNLVLLVTTEQPSASASATVIGTSLAARLAGEDGVEAVASYWTLGSPPELVSTDGHTALVLAHLPGDELAVRRTLDRLSATYETTNAAVEGVAPVQVRLGGRAAVARAISETSEADLRRAEAIALPATLILLVLVFGGPLAALLPLCVAALAVLGTMAGLRGLVEVTDVSVFALNLTTGLGLGLAIDYSLFVIARFREELGRGQSVARAITVAMSTAGRTVTFSAITIGSCLAALLVFPLGFLRSTAYAGILVVTLAAISALVVLPALLAVVGRQIDVLDPLASRRRAAAAAGGSGAGVWGRLTRTVLRRPGIAAAAVTLLLALLAVPFLDARFTNSDDRTLPPDAAVRQVHDVLRSQFPFQVIGQADVVVPSLVLGTAAGRNAASSYALSLSQLDGTGQVNGPTGSYRDGVQVRAVPTPSGTASAAPAVFAVLPDVDPASPAAEHLVATLRARAPAGALVGGPTAEQVDARHALDRRTPLALLVVALVTATLILVFSGGVLLAVKALGVNLLSLTASFGAMVWVFQEGHLREVLGGFTVTGSLDATTPILMFCLAFGLSMDYEILLLSRIKEAYDRDGLGVRAAVGAGLSASAGLMTSAAAIVAIVFLALLTSDVAFLKLLGLGLAIAVILDATLVRGVLVPGAIVLAGRANWWAPRPVLRVHERLGAAERGPAPGPVGPRRAARLRPGDLQKCAELTQRLGAGPVVHPGAATLALDEPGLPQHLEVVGDRRPGQLEGVGEVAHARLGL